MTHIQEPPARQYIRSLATRERMRKAHLGLRHSCCLEELLTLVRKSKHQPVGRTVA